MAFLSIPISHPLPTALSRSAILHDMSEESFEYCTPVMVLSPARKESGKKPVKQRPRRRRKASERYEHAAEEQIRGRRNDFHLQISSPRWRELYTDSSDSSSSDESHWIQAKRRAQVKFRLSRRRRRNNNKLCENVAGSSTSNGIELVDLGPKGKEQQEPIECESCSLNLRRGKGTRYQECNTSLTQGSSEIKSSSRNHEKSKGRYHHRDPQLLQSLRKNEIIKKKFSETDSSTEILAATEGGKDMNDAGLQVNNPVRKPPATYDDGSDNLETGYLASTATNESEIDEPIGPTASALVEWLSYVGILNIESGDLASNSSLNLEWSDLKKTLNRELSSFPQGCPTDASQNLSMFCLTFTSSTGLAKGSTVISAEKGQTNLQMQGFENANSAVEDAPFQKQMTGQKSDYEHYYLQVVSVGTSKCSEALPHFNGIEPSPEVVRHPREAIPIESSQTIAEFNRNGCGDENEEDMKDTEVNSLKILVAKSGISKGRNNTGRKSSLRGLILAAVSFCRICHCEGDEESPLITPCRCTGTLRFVHQSCLHQWIKSSDTRCCELCKYDFIMETKLKPLRKTMYTDCHAASPLHLDDPVITIWFKNHEMEEAEVKTLAVADTRSTKAYHFSAGGETYLDPTATDTVF
ncbi:hypothetical protein P7K49_007044 [Saguinus oedipus]|uniref:RING-CH-type domain-containing protein n=1 Tax=Saguinus oedipus TaxID=9490 RepID=A0ABQ9W457_SAGOE|nr:hypothetical protein P7K49_007044 [Saguinus oedipus]